MLQKTKQFFIKNWHSIVIATILSRLIVFLYENKEDFTQTQKPKTITEEALNKSIEDLHYIKIKKHLEIATKNLKSHLNAKKEKSEQSFQNLVTLLKPIKKDSNNDNILEDTTTFPTILTSFYMLVYTEKLFQTKTKNDIVEKNKKHIDDAIDIFEKNIVISKPNNIFENPIYKKLENILDKATAQTSKNHTVNCYNMLRYCIYYLDTIIERYKNYQKKEMQKFL